MLKDKKLIYISCAYGGDKERLNLCESYIRHMVDKDKKMEKNNRVYISPLHAFGYLYDDVGYMEGLDMTLKLLEQCDEMYIIEEGYKDSRGVTIEIGFAKAKNIPITVVSIDTWMGGIKYSKLD